MRTFSSFIICTLLISFEMAGSDRFPAGSGRPLEVGPERQISNSQRIVEPRPAVAWNGSLYLAVWEEFAVQPGGNSTTIVGRRLDRTGVALDETPFPIAQGVSPVLASDGVNFMLVFIGSGGLLALQIPGEAGSIGQPSVVATNLIMTPRWFKSPQIEFGAGSYVVVWEQHELVGFESAARTQSDIRARRLTSEGVPLEPAAVTLTSIGDKPSWPAIAWSGHEFLVVWTNLFPQCDMTLCHSEQIFGTFLDPSLAHFETVAVSNRIEVSKNSITDDVPWNFEPQVGWNGEHFLVVWGGWPKDRQVTELYATRLSPAGDFPDGRPSDGGGIVIRGTAPLQKVTSIVSRSGDFHVIWEEGVERCWLSGCARPRGSYGNLYGVVISPDGVLGATYSVSTEEALEAGADAVLRLDGHGIVVYYSRSNIMTRVIGGPGRTRPVRPRGSARYP